MIDSPSTFKTAVVPAILRITLFIPPILSAVMALVSKYNAHPDEPNHFEAVKYYVHHFLPPEIGDPAVVDSYSVWGVSYLNYHWIEYFLAGKFVLLTAPLLGSEVLAARSFNVFLLFILAVFFAYRSRRDASQLIIPSLLLITPQVWYVFSYVNNDAFALFISILTSYQISYPGSISNRFFLSDHLSKNLAGGVFFGSLIGALLIVKTNYYAFLVFAALWMLYKLPVERITDRRIEFRVGPIKKYAFVTLVAISILAFRCSLDIYVNGETNFVGLSYVSYFFGNFEKEKSHLMLYQEQIAAPPFKPSTIENDLSNTYPGMKMKAKGTSYRDMFKHWRWHEISFKSFVGIYGYMSILGPEVYYRLMWLLYLAFGTYSLAAVFRGRGWESIPELSLISIGFLLTVMISSYLSWTYAFQPQGRYLFPVIGMSGIFVYSNRQYVYQAPMYLFIFAAFLLSVYSFVFVGLSKINE